ncbi:hypothetical protein CYLTODRAFT_417062 [Cylindrobasidium torrendii FP15055 ss-10]|uniref:Uncharacterized protein n=1 Tax=Cylindrobasidium torrendii FP15055 ss-10 TaxID=1314674 RepID=A0A0D7BT00_9AGAR|nr:hypothetical protein CYLTODRAFT_417062 [Cylindrobasidium torrendii FP15055 ss-10]
MSSAAPRSTRSSTRSAKTTPMQSISAPQRPNIQPATPTQAAAVENRTVTAAPPTTSVQAPLKTKSKSKKPRAVKKSALVLATSSGVDGSPIPAQQSTVAAADASPVAALASEARPQAHVSIPTPRPKPRQAKNTLLGVTQQSVREEAASNDLNEVDAALPIDESGQVKEKPQTEETALPLNAQCPEGQALAATGAADEDDSDNESDTQSLSEADDNDSPQDSSQVPEDEATAMPSNEQEGQMAVEKTNPFQLFEDDFVVPDTPSDIDSFNDLQVRKQSKPESQGLPAPALVAYPGRDAAIKAAGRFPKTNQRSKASTLSVFEDLLDAFASPNSPQKNDPNYASLGDMAESARPLLSQLPTDPDLIVTPKLGFPRVHYPFDFWTRGVDTGIIVDTVGREDPYMVVAHAISSQYAPASEGSARTLLSRVLVEQFAIPASDLQYDLAKAGSPDESMNFGPRVSLVALNHGGGPGPKPYATLFIITGLTEDEYEVIHNACVLFKGSMKTSWAFSKVLGYMPYHVCQLTNIATTFNDEGNAILRLLIIATLQKDDAFRKFIHDHHDAIPENVAKENRVEFILASISITTVHLNKSLTTGQPDRLSSAVYCTPPTKLIAHTVEWLSFFKGRRFAFPSSHRMAGTGGNPTSSIDIHTCKACLGTDHVLGMCWLGEVEGFVVKPQQQNQQSQFRLPAQSSVSGPAEGKGRNKRPALAPMGGDTNRPRKL